jgi:hypothetical protein
MAINHDEIRPPVDSTGKRVDNATVDRAGTPVYRQVGCIGSPDNAGIEQIAEVKNSLPDKAAMGVVVRQAPIELLEAAILINATGDNFVIAAPGLGHHVKVYKLWFQTADDITIDLKRGTTSLCGPVLYAQGGSQSWGFDHAPWFTCGDNEGFNINLDRAGVNVCGRVSYTVETP